MKQIKLYDMICPFWLILFIPPFLFISLAANFIIDSLVVIVCFYIFKVSGKEQIKLKYFYKKSIVKVWLFGFFADILGIIVIFFSLYMSSKITNGYTLACVIGMLTSSGFIFMFNYCIIYNKIITDTHLRKEISLTIAIITIPWTFLIPYMIH